MREIIDIIQLRPKQCVWELTTQCNMHCLHCASDLGESHNRSGSLSLADALRICHELQQLECETVVLSGGEALLHNHWEAIARELVGVGITVSLISNGLTINEEKVDRIRDAGICRVALSLDGMKETHNYIRCNPSSFDSVIQAFEHLKSRGLQVNVVTHINRINREELPMMEDLVAELGTDVWRLQLASPVGRLARHPDLCLLVNDLPLIADFIVAAKSRGRVYIDVGDNVGYFSAHEPDLRSCAQPSPFPFWCGCSAGCLTVGIEANGNVKGCLSLQSEQFVEGNLNEESLLEIWRRPGSFRYTRGFTVDMLHGYCKDCEFGEICRGGCTFMAFGATGAAHNNPYCLYRTVGRASGGASKTTNGTLLSTNCTMSGCSGTS